VAYVCIKGSLVIVDSTLVVPFEQSVISYIGLCSGGCRTCMKTETNDKLKTGLQASESPSPSN